MDFDHGICLKALYVFQNMHGEWVTIGLPMLGKIPSHSSVLFLFYIRDMTLKHFQFSTFSLAHIPYMANITFQAIYEIIALTVPMHYGVIEIV